MGLDIIMQLLLALSGLALLFVELLYSSALTLLNCELSGDIETNPGPFWKKEEDPVENLQDTVETHGDEISDLKETVDKQSDTMEEMLNKLVELSIKADDIKLDSEKNAKEIIKVSQTVEDGQSSILKLFQKVSEDESRLGQERVQQKVKSGFQSINQSGFQSIKAFNPSYF